MKVHRLLGLRRVPGAAALALVLILTGPAPAPQTTAAAADPRGTAPARRQVPLRRVQSLPNASGGSFLVASRQLRDPNFKESVVLLIAHDGNGALGLVINRPTAIPLTEVLPGIAGLEGRRLYFGGPVSAGRPLFLLRSPTPPGSARKVLDDVYVGSDELVLKRAIAEGAGEYRLYSGYSGWGAGQLEAELARGDWHVLPAEARHIFSDQPAQLWDELTRRLEELRVTRGQPGWFQLPSASGRAGC